MKKILFIEDESALQRAVTETAPEKEFKILSATDGEEGLRIAQSETPDLILLDLILPKKDGFGVLTELKKNPKTVRIPVVILTNLEGIQDVERAIELGATTYLIKTSYNLKEVIQKIREILHA